MFHHDILYHVVIDMNNPHIDIYCRLAATIQSLATSMKNPPMKQFFLDFAFNIVDREVSQYTHLPPEIALLTYLNKEFSSQIELYRQIFFMDASSMQKISIFLSLPILVTGYGIL